MSIDLDFADGLAVITINRPDALNALSFQLLHQIGEAIDAVDRSDARALIVTGAGDRAFCAGADIKELMGRSQEDARRGLTLGRQAFAKLDDLRIASIALVNGFSFGGGTELALACTFRLALPEAKFGLPEIKLGLIPGYGGTQRLPRLVGEARAAELILTGRTVDASEALRIGLVNRIVENPGLAAAKAFAAEFTGYSLLAAHSARMAIHRGLQMSLEHGLALETDLATLGFETADADEGMRAFSEKRPARFADR
ncbi:enoyl-CoA hydratase/isomerase family protein [Novosphingobium mangrovi (ex Huang et al. 2023)]|uniref:Enoyl-CoA hydratase-related protein n=1 Tax=Novosphingobium mangrovi (ex Huang et al. 2023) TaxID=2976432 RepID=A0ABT2I8V8_9SPHN|nr:enoyl-CoA hydratase-related protein [Novosphingobium mangrovi (ex Huang et al. 2023)]MCT2401211.1 enoyl-CoA hydratase-related protein [Novosphingobium mangrovi (ex Huang et al. 2023)]